MARSQCAQASVTDCAVAGDAAIRSMIKACVLFLSFFLSFFLLSLKGEESILISMTGANHPRPTRCNLMAGFVFQVYQSESPPIGRGLAHGLHHPSLHPDRPLQKQAIACLLTYKPSHLLPHANSLLGVWPDLFSTLLDIVAYALILRLVIMALPAKTLRRKTTKTRSKRRKRRRRALRTD